MPKTGKSTSGAAVGTVSSRQRRSGHGNRWRRVSAGVGLAGVLTAVGVFVTTPAEAASGFSDGSFETPVVNPHTFHTYYAGESFGPWTVTSGSVELNGEGFWQHADGNQSLDLDGADTGAAAQTFATNLLTKYKVTYSLAGNTDYIPIVKTGKVLVNGQLAQNFSFDTTGKSRTDMGYVTKGFTFLSSGRSTTLEFVSTTTPGGYGPVIDKVRVDSCLLIICLP
jgi:choice-of-anchor C domain-containing protein